MQQTSQERWELLSGENFPESMVSIIHKCEQNRLDGIKFVIGILQGAEIRRYENVRKMAFRGWDIRKFCEWCLNLKLIENSRALFLISEVFSSGEISASFTKLSDHRDDNCSLKNVKNNENILL